VSSVSAPLERGLALCASGALLTVRAIAHVSARFSLVALELPDPDVWQLALLSAGAMGVITSATRTLRGIWLLASFCGLFALEIQIRRLGAPLSELRMTAIDVGQGDATLVDFPDGRSMLIDAGGSMQGADPGARAVVPLLRARRRQRLDVVVLSHPHPDHFGGLLSVIKAVDVGEFWDSGQGQTEGAGPRYAELMRELARRRIPVLRPPDLCNQPRSFGAARVETLAPCPSFTPGRDANDNSMVLKLAFGARRVLLVGDAEIAEERELMTLGAARLRADVLKVGHHGSRTSSSAEFLSYVKPRIGTIACGVRNRFGHPHQSVLERFVVSGVAALRLDRVGSVIYRTDGSNQELFTFSSPR
jgi:competence protein ComEC